MSRRAFAFVGLFAVVAAITLPIYLLTAHGEADSILPGVPLSVLEREGMHIDLADGSDFLISPADAATAARPSVCTQVNADPVAEVIPVHLRSTSDPEFDGRAWAAVIDTSTGFKYPPFGCIYRTIVLRGWDYDAVFIDGDTGDFLTTLHPEH